MTDFIISSESIMDLSPTYVNQLGVSIINSNYELNGKIFQDDFGQSLDMETFYKNMENGSSPSTSAINTEEYLEYFRKLLKKGYDIIHVCLSSGLSVQYTCLVQAVEILKEEFPDRTIHPVDSKMASAGVGLLVVKLVELKQVGKSYEEICKWVDDNYLRVISYTSNENLEYLARGGRISKASANIGNLLRICPLIEMDDTGHMEVTAKIRTKKKLVTTLLKRMEKNAIGQRDYNDYVFITHASNIEFANEIKNAVEESFPNTKGKVKISNFGPTIGTHIGPGAISLFYWGNKRLA
ncbi:DegV family protein [uncultured Anaerococcus sp.]|uniref:DegV family protein n=1 Tax=uncultured Anaerococcus sp. TaxID=293428 RepID=UPI00261E5019|nr:DegV family protein [uncultured Anaerococcus sp.]